MSKEQPRYRVVKSYENLFKKEYSSMLGMTFQLIAKKIAQFSKEEKGNKK